MNEGMPGMWGFIGIDPGITSGIAWTTVTQFIGTGYAPARCDWDAHCASCDGDALIDLLLWRIDVYAALGTPILLCGEKFVKSNRHAGSQADHDKTRDVLATCMNMARRHNPLVKCVLRTAAEVKPWANDNRLSAIGFPMAPKLKDGRDAGRHMMFGAVKSGRAADPLL